MCIVEYAVCSRTSLDSPNQWMQLFQIGDYCIEVLEVFEVGVGYVIPLKYHDHLAATLELYQLQTINLLSSSNLNIYSYRANRNHGARW